LIDETVRIARGDAQRTCRHEARLDRNVECQRSPLRGGAHDRRRQYRHDCWRRRRWRRWRVPTPAPAARRRGNACCKRAILHPEVRGADLFSARHSSPPFPHTFPLPRVGSQALPRSVQWKFHDDKQRRRSVRLVKSALSKTKGRRFPGAPSRVSDLRRA
jgi:hypothetical protein